MSISATVKAMAAAGCTAQQIADVVELLDRTDEKRALAAKRQAAWRERQKARNANNE
jgi:hypothetical protein